ncbi:glycosyltransferase family 1 protein [Nocardioides albidus]|uniref:Glycosyltransferase family 1 protein n=1 Tax=Nocardioides albidus TaxID=1517589 RepID=A0A5C4VWV1_9ACTN|nr:glycosyltransferase [Nocardioides albidus]TNM39775.1 glycosyltransferase family 1 protein [Nocardioides albidus]
MSRYLIATWDGAGNLVPTLGITRTLVERGHDVRMLGHDTIAERCGDVGARFVPLTQRAGWDAMEDPDDFEAEVKLMIEGLCFSSTIARDLARELDREPADAVLVDAMLFTAIDVALASGTPTAALFHTPYTIFRGGPLVEAFAPGIAIANAHRADLGLPAIERIGDIHDACAKVIVAVPKEFEPDAPDAPNVLRIGPVLDAPPLSREIDEVDIRDGSTPLVLVSLSTSEQGQADLLQRCVDAVAQLPVRAIVTTGSVDPASVNASPDTQVVRYAPHAEILPSTSLVITHAGFGTVMAALGRGVPLLCTPMGRDQFFNAGQAQTLGAARMLMPDSSSDTIAQAAADILEDDRFTAAAKQLAVAIGGYGGAAKAATAIEAL